MNRQEVLWMLEGKVKVLTDAQVEEVYEYMKYITEKEEKEQEKVSVEFPILEMIARAREMWNLAEKEEENVGIPIEPTKRKRKPHRKNGKRQKTT